jgi:hypothetical protein
VVELVCFAIMKMLSRFGLGRKSGPDSGNAVTDTKDPIARNGDDTANYDTMSIDSEDKQAGVKKVEAVALTWSRVGLYVAYLGSVSQSTCVLA